MHKQRIYIIGRDSSRFGEKDLSLKETETKKFESIIKKSQKKNQNESEFSIGLQPWS